METWLIWIFGVGWVLFGVGWARERKGCETALVLKDTVLDMSHKTCLRLARNLRAANEEMELLRGDLRAAADELQRIGVTRGKDGRLHKR